MKLFGVCDWELVESLRHLRSHPNNDKLAIKRRVAFMIAEEEKIINALRDERWDYRTVEGIAKGTGIPVDTVRTFLKTHKDIVRKSSIPDRLGRDLYTLNNRYSQGKEFWRGLSTFMSKKA